VCVCVCVKIVRHALLRHAVDRGVKRAVIQRKKNPSVFVDRKGRSGVVVQCGTARVREGGLRGGSENRPNLYRA
uniref:Uncharacterized protein n=1 Tax=Anopheles quadriannulatus TaxID=34691 RepID=A0A182XQS1_ANOQN